MSADLKESPAPLAEISQAPNAFEAFLDRNQKGIVVLAILLALGGAAAVILRGIEKSRQETAGAALVKADDIAALQAVVSEHANTNAAGSAMVLLADRQWAAGKQDEAIGTLQKFIADAPSHIAIPTAKASLGSKLMLHFRKIIGKNFKRNGFVLNFTQNILCKSFIILNTRFTH